MRILYLTKLFFLFVILSVFSFGQDKNELPKSGQVFLNVRVVDKYNEPVPDLKMENFRLFENKKPLEIVSFDNQNSPLSVGFLIDSSQSMGNYVDISRESILAFLENSNPQNEYFVTAFNDRLDNLLEFTNFDETVKMIAVNPYFLKSKRVGKMILYDAIIDSVEKLSKAKNQKKVLFVFWDADEEDSSGKYKKVEKVIGENNITVYLIGYDVVLQRPFKDSAEDSGGAAIYPRRGEFEDSSLAVLYYRSKYYTAHEFYLLKFIKIAKQFSNQYKIGFKPNLDGDTKKKRNLEIKLEIQKELRKKIGFTEALYRKGFYPFSEVVTSN